MNDFTTQGIDHLGLTVANLQNSLDFFVKALGWKQFGGNPDYPSAYITDGYSKLTLWQKKCDEPVPFDRHTNIGLHHFALKLSSPDELNAAFNKVHNWPGVEIEFSPELSGNGPKQHFMIIEPGGTRMEFSFDPR